MKSDGHMSDDDVQAIEIDDGPCSSSTPMKPMKPSSARKRPVRLLTEDTKPHRLEDKKKVLLHNGMLVPGQRGQIEDSVDFVAQLTHNRLRTQADPVFSQYVSIVPRTRKAIKSYTLNSHVNERVVHVGTEDNGKGFGYDYAVAVVDATSGRATFHPTRFIQFEAKSIQDSAVLFGQKAANKPNFELDFSSKGAVWAEKRKQLTSEFGSAKKNKLLQAAERRHIEDDSLQAMLIPALEATGDGADGDDGKMDISKLAKIGENVSQVLPLANLNAELAKDVYSWNLFFTEKEIEFLGPIAVKVLETPAKNLIEQGYGELALKLTGNLLGDQKLRHAAAVVLLSTFQHFYSKTKKVLYLQDIAKFPMPGEFVNKVKSEYFGHANTQAVGRGRSEKTKILMNASYKDRLLSHTIVLILLLNSGTFTLPVSPWMEALQCGDRKITQICQALGCTVLAASKDEMNRYKTNKMARLVGPPRTDGKGRNRRKVNARRTL